MAWVFGATVLHVMAAMVLVLGPLYRDEALPLLGSRDPVRVLVYDPPPPPPPPLPRGSPTGGRSPRKAASLAAPIPPPVREEALVAPVEEATTVDASSGVTVEAPGDPEGHESGVPEGMAEGVPGGVVGGLPGGVLGGVIGGTGRGPVPVPVRDADVPPRLLKQVRPAYPSEAFVKKVEGTVVIELLIDERGRVARARIVRSVPLLDEAAVEAVRQWAFVPASKRGRAVASLALAPVTFRIF